MKRIHSLNDPMLAEQLRGVLEANGIDAELKNLDLRTALGEIPLAECWIEVWIQDPAQEASAMAIIRGQASDAEQLPAWTCEGCGEKHDGQFGACWKCGAPAVNG